MLSKVSSIFLEMQLSVCVFFTVSTISLFFNGATMVESSSRSFRSFRDGSLMRELAIQTNFQLPSPLPNWPQGGGFGGGTIDLGGLQVSQVTTFNKIWAANEGGPGGSGATFYEPASIPEGYSPLGFYSQPNNMPLFGHVLVGKDITNDTSNPTLKPPIDYTLVWTSFSRSFKKDGEGYIWFPVPPGGYNTVGYVITSTSEKPGLDRVRCVRADLTDSLETDMWIWGDADGFNAYSSRPTNRGVEFMGAPVGGFVVGIGGVTLTLSCLKNMNAYGSLVHTMPNKDQIKALIDTYSPVVYFHPDEEYLPSSVHWFFDNGALLYHQGDESNPSRVAQNGGNLPQGGSDDETYWLDFSSDMTIDEEERVKKGDLEYSYAYFHIKPMYGGLYTDIPVWLFYPFNGPSRAKLWLINISLGVIGEHLGDWEHVTLRISNLNGELISVFFSQHNKGSWVSASALEYASGNKFVVYSSLHSHASYPSPGLVLIGPKGLGSIGVRDDTWKSDKVMDTGARAWVIAAEYLTSAVFEQPWVNYLRKWGPKIDYDPRVEAMKVEKKISMIDREVLLGEYGRTVPMNKRFTIPKELFGEIGPTGPKAKSSWSGDEMS